LPDALIAESFTGRLRYSCSSFWLPAGLRNRRRSSPLSSRPRCSAPYQSPHAISLYILFCALLSLISTALMKDYTGKDIAAEYE
jgi:hypothetical protein